MIADIIPKLAVFEREDEHDFYPRPSSAGPEKCERQMVYHGLKVPKAPLSGRALLVFDDSSWHEELTIDWIRKSTFDVHSQQMPVKCRAPMDVKDSHIDGIVTDLADVDRLLEHKAINHFGFQRTWAGELPMDNLTQTCVDLEGLQREANPDMKQAILLIKNKNTAQYMEFILEYDGKTDVCKILEKCHSNGDREVMDVEIPNIVTAACDKFNRILDYIERKTLPKRQYNWDHWRCEYCQWGEKCWDGYEKEFEELKTDELLPNEVADMVRYRQETGGHKRELLKGYDELTAQIKQTMKDAGVREGRAGEYVVRMKLQKKSTLDKSLLTDAEIAKATKISVSERLHISKPKQKKEG